MIEKEFAPYELALRMKELGFDEPCFGSYVFGDKLSIKYCEDQFITDSCCLSPTFSQAFRWFRERYGLYYFEDHRCNSKTDMSSITYWMGIKKLKLAPFGSEVLVGIIELGCYNAYEEAELACLTKLIEIVETRTK